MAELRSFIFLNRLQPQTMCYLGTWIRGSLPRSDVAAQIIEIAPGYEKLAAAALRVLGDEERGIPAKSPKQYTLFDAKVVDRYLMEDGRLGHAILTVAGESLYLSDEYPELGVTSPQLLGGRRSPFT